MFRKTKKEIEALKKELSAKEAEITRLTANVRGLKRRIDQPPKFEIGQVILKDMIIWDRLFVTRLNEQLLFQALTNQDFSGSPQHDDFWKYQVLEHGSGERAWFTEDELLREIVISKNQ